MKKLLQLVLTSHWRTVPLIAAIAATCATHASAATTWYVNSTTGTTSGTGTSALPFKTIAAATTNPSLVAGDTISVASGTYNEAVTITKGVTVTGTGAHAPLITGMTTVPPAPTSWTTYSGTTAAAGTVYTTTPSGVIRDMYDSTIMRIGLDRFPYIFAPWAEISNFVPSTGTITLSAPLGITITTPLSAFVYVYNAGGDVYNAYPIQSVSGSTIVLSSAYTYTANTEIKANDKLIVCNHPQLLHNTNDWCYSSNGTASTTLYAYPSNTSYLSGWQYRHNNGANNGSNKQVLISAANTTLNNLQIEGGWDFGIYVNASSNVTINQCVVRENGSCTATVGDGTTGGSGISSNKSDNLLIQGCVVTNNGHGIATGGGHNVTLKQDEICWNDSDGADLTGRATYNGDFANGAQNVTVDQCYIHHQMNMEHPDCLQLYNSPSGIYGVYGINVTNSLFMFGGQNFMMQEVTSPTYDATTKSNFTNDLCVSSAARSWSIGHYTETNLAFSNDSIVFAQIYGVGIDATPTAAPSNLSFLNNVYYQSGAYYNGPNVTGFVSNYNLYFVYDLTGVNNTGDLGAYYSHNDWTLAELRTYDSQDANSLYSGITGASPAPAVLYNNVPVLQVSMDDWNATVVTTGSPGSTAIHVAYNNNNPTKRIAIGDYVEVNGDGVQRQVTAYSEPSPNTTNPPVATVTFSPGLGARPWRHLFLWDWGTTAPTSMVLDTGYQTGSPALTGGPGGTSQGANINVANYMAGKFDGSQDLPPIPGDVSNAWNHPYWSYPYAGTTP